jgi:hypothetical protein
VLRMSDIGPELPADIKALQALVVATRAQLDSAIAERDAMILERNAANSRRTIGARMTYRIFRTIR